LAPSTPDYAPTFEQLNDADLEKVCATTLLLNGNRLRELAGTDAADAVLAIAAETLWINDNNERTYPQ
jgi:hypothetical protein